MIGTVIVSLAAFAGVRAAKERMRRGSAMLDETLPVNSNCWRAHARQEGALLHVAIGASAAQGIGASAPNHSYVGLIAERMRELTGQGLHVVNLSASGATTALAIATRINPATPTPSPGVTTPAPTAAR